MAKTQIGGAFEHPGSNRGASTEIHRLESDLGGRPALGDHGQHVSHGFVQRDGS